MSKGLERAQEAMRAKREAGEEVERRNPMEKHLDEPSSRALAVAAKCFDCVGGLNADGGYRRCIRECASPRCPLYNFRPYK